MAFRTFSSWRNILKGCKKNSLELWFIYIEQRKQKSALTFGRFSAITFICMNGHGLVCRISFTGVCVGMSIMGTQALHFSYYVLCIEGMPWYRVDFVLALCLCVLFYVIVLCLGESAVSILIQPVELSEDVYSYSDPRWSQCWNPTANEFQNHCCWVCPVTFVSKLCLWL